MKNQKILFGLISLFILLMAIQTPLNSKGAVPYTFVPIDDFEIISPTNNEHIAYLEESYIISLEIDFDYSSGPSPYLYSFTTYLKIDSESYSSLNTHANINNWYFNSDHFPIIDFDFSGYSSDWHILYVKIIDHYSEDAEFYDQRNFKIDNDPSASGINLSVINNYDDYYLTENPNLKIGSYDADGLNSCHVSIGNYSVVVEDDSSFLNETINPASTYTKNIEMDWNQQIINYTTENLQVSTAMSQKWYNLNWNYRMYIYFTSIYSYSDITLKAYLYDGEMDFDFDDCQDDFDDILITDIDETSPSKLYHWIENYNSSCIELWFKTDVSVGDNYVNCYYGNPTATNTESKDDVFLWHDDFEKFALGSGVSGVNYWSIAGGYDDGEVIANPDGSGKVLKIWSTTGGYLTSLTASWGEFGEIILEYDINIDLNYKVYLGSFMDEGSSAYTVRYETTGSKIQYYTGATYSDYNPNLPISQDTWYNIQHAVFNTDCGITSGGSYYDGGFDNRGGWVDGSEEAIFSGYSTATNSKWYADNFTVRKYYTMIDVLGVGSSTSERPHLLDVDIDITNQTTPLKYGENISVIYDPDYAFLCSISGTVSYYYNDKSIDVYTSSSETSQYDNYLISSDIWDEIPEGVFWLNVTIFDDGANNISDSWQFCKIISYPTIDFRSPINGSIYTAGLPISLTYVISLDISRDYTDFVYINNSLTSFNNGDSILLAAGIWNISIIIVDEAGFTHEKTHTFEIIDKRDITFHFYSSIDGLGLDNEIVKIYIKDILHQNFSRINPSSSIAGETFDLQILDYFNNELYFQENISYARHFDIGLPLIECSFIHNATYYYDEYIPVRVYLSNNYSTMEFSLSSPFEIHTIRLLLNTNYTVVCMPEKQYSSDNKYIYYPLKTEISVTKKANEKTKTFSVSIAADALYEEEKPNFLKWMQLNWWWMSIAISVIGLASALYYRYRQTKMIEGKSFGKTYSGSKYEEENYDSFRESKEKQKNNRRKYK